MARPEESDRIARSRSRRDLERELAGKGYRRTTADRWGTYWISPDSRTRLYLDDIGVFYYERNFSGWRRLWGRCWENLILNDLMFVSF